MTNQQLLDRAELNKQTARALEAYIADDTTELECLAFSYDEKGHRVDPIGKWRPYKVDRYGTGNIDYYHLRVKDESLNHEFQFSTEGD